MTRALPLIVLALAALAPPADAMPRVSDRDLAELREGEVVVEEREPTGGDGVAARAMAIVDAPPAEVWPVITDCANYHRFMPRTKKSEVRGDIPGGHRCFVEIEMPFPFDNLWSVAAATNTANPDGSFRRHWTLVKGTYKRNTGAWELYPLDDGKKTLLVYEIDVDPDVSLPDWVIASAQTGALPDLFQSVRKRIRKR